MRLSSKIWLQNAPWTICLWRKTPRVLGHTRHFFKIIFSEIRNKHTVEVFQAEKKNQLVMQQMAACLWFTSRKTCQIILKATSRTGRCNIHLMSSSSKSLQADRLFCLWSWMADLLPPSRPPPCDSPPFSPSLGNGPAGCRGAGVLPVGPRGSVV